MRGKSETKILLYIKSQVELNKKVKEKFQQIKCDVKADFINSFFSLYAKIALNYIEIAWNIFYLTITLDANFKKRIEISWKQKINVGWFKIFII